MKAVANNEELFQKHWGMTLAEAEEQLRMLYAEINSAKFKGELPENVYIKITFEAAGKASTKIMSGFGSSIFVHPLTHPTQYRQIMIHEMCHLVTYDGHGPNFQAKLKEVGAGEPWLDTELKQCPEWVQDDKINREWIECAIELLKTSPDMRWIDARRVISRRLGCKVRRFDEVVHRSGNRFKDYWLRARMSRP